MQINTRVLKTDKKQSMSVNCPSPRAETLRSLIDPAENLDINYPNALEHLEAAKQLLIATLKLVIPIANPEADKIMQLIAEVDTKRRILAKRREVFEQKT